MPPFRRASSGIGLPLTIGAGAATAALLFRGSGLWVAAAIGAIVAPTDAALGASIMADERVPSGVRRLINVESGLNDGIATPFVNLFIAGAVTAEAVSGTHLSKAVVELVGGAGLGIAVGVVGAVLLALARRHGWSSPNVRPLAILAPGALRLLELGRWRARTASSPPSSPAWPSAPWTTTTTRPRCASPRKRARSSRSWSGSSSGPSCSSRASRASGWRDAVFALLALTVLRMVPVAIALAGTGLDRATVAFVGWFGPRGLASVVFGLIAVDSLAPSESKVVLGAVTLTVALSVLLHGVTASPLAARYGAYAARARSGGSGAHRRRRRSRPVPCDPTRPSLGRRDPAH